MTVVRGIRDPRGAWRDHRGDAKRRGILFLLTFEEWLGIWIESGHLHERGNCRGQYQMARFEDKGPYDKQNIKIILAEENNSEGHKGKRRSLGPQSPEHRRKIGLANKGRKLSEQTKSNMSDAHKGHKLSKDHAKRIKEGLFYRYYVLGLKRNNGSRYG